VRVSLVFPSPNEGIAGYRKQVPSQSCPVSLAPLVTTYLDKVFGSAFEIHFLQPPSPSPPVALSMLPYSLWYVYRSWLCSCVQVNPTFFRHDAAKVDGIKLHLTTLLRSRREVSTPTTTYYNLFH
jgi:hypothetical protein